MKKKILTSEETAFLCRELQLIIRSGLEAGGALALVAEDCGDKALKELILSLVDALDSGLSLADALQSSGALPGYVCALAKVGQATGRSEEAFAALADYYFRQAELEKGLKNALLYPSVLILVMLAVIVVLFTRVLPMFEDVYARLGASLSGAAALMLSIGRAMEALLPLFAAIIAVFVIFAGLFALCLPFRRACLDFWRRHFGDRGLARLLGRARFAAALAMGMKSGLLAEEALSLAALTLAGTPAEERCESCAAALAGGEALGKALRGAALMPAANCRLLELAEKGGCADSVMVEIAEKLARSGEEELEKALGRVEPAMVLVCCAIVAAALLSVMLPLMNIMRTIA